MAVLMGTNTTCDVYRSTNAPPASPDVAGVAIYLKPKGQSTLTTPQYTHVANVAVGTDIRDDFISGGGTGTWVGLTADTIYVPNKTGTAFQVVLVRRIGRGTSGDMLEMLLLRETNSGAMSPQPPWPTSNL